VSRPNRSWISAQAHRLTAGLGVPLQGPVHGIEEDLFLEGLLDEVQGPRLHRPHGHGDITMACDHDDGGR